jgi:hypothetical protein
MNLERLLESLNIAAAQGVELDDDEREVLALLRLLRRVDDGNDARRKRIDDALAKAAEARSRRDAAAVVTFPRTPRAPDDLVVIGYVRPERSTFCIDRREDGTLEFNAVVSDAATGKGVYRFSPRRSVHYVPREIYDVIPERVRSGITFRDSVPRDLWKYVGGVENFLPFNRTINSSRGSDGRESQPTPEEREAATAAAIARCRELASGCASADVLAAWLEHSESAGEAAPVLRALLERRLQELGGSAPPAPDGARRAPRVQIPAIPEPTPATPVSAGPPAPEAA